MTRLPHKFQREFQDQLNTEKSKDDRTGVQGQRAAEYKANQEAFQTIQDNYRNEIDKTKKAFEDSEKDIKSAQEKWNHPSFRNAAEQRSTLIAKELTDIERPWLRSIRTLAQKSGANPQNVQKFVDGLSTVGANAGTDANSAQAANTAAEDQDQRR